MIWCEYRKFCPPSLTYTIISPEKLQSNLINHIGPLLRSSAQIRGGHLVSGVMGPCRERY